MPAREPATANALLNIFAAHVAAGLGNVGGLGTGQVLASTSSGERPGARGAVLSRADATARCGAAGLQHRTAAARASPSRDARTPSCLVTPPQAGSLQRRTAEPSCGCSPPAGPTCCCCASLWAMCWAALTQTPTPCLCWCVGAGRAGPGALARAYAPPRTCGVGPQRASAAAPRMHTRRKPHPPAHPPAVYSRAQPSATACRTFCRCCPWR